MKTREYHGCQSFRLSDIQDGRPKQSQLPLTGDTTVTVSCKLAYGYLIRVSL